MADLKATNRPLISIVGAHSDSGKTTFTLHLLRSIPGLGCLKISPARDWPDGRSVGARLVGEDFYLADAEHLRRRGKDTGRYLEAGAIQVERLRHRGAGLAAGLEAALDGYPQGLPVIVESSSAVRFLDPVAVMLIVRTPLREMKPTTQAILPRVTDLLINTSDRMEPGVQSAEELERSFSTLRPQHTWTLDLLHQPIPEALLARFRGLLIPTA
ncbi:MAG: hypothetical protein GY842_03425 [bacterium]|nr:hypothetical protein [bacterium]